MPKVKAPIDERRSERRDGAAEILLERGDRHDRERADGDHDQPADEAARLPAREEAPPRRGVAEFGFQEGDAEAEAAEDQRRRGGLAVEQHQRDQDRGGDQRETEEQAVDAERRRAHRARSMLPWTLELPRCLNRSGTEAELLLQIVPFGARGFNGRMALLVHSTIEPA